MNISSSKERYTFQRDAYLKRQLEKGKTPKNCSDTADMLSYYNQVIESEKNKHLDEDFQKDNLEYELRTTEWILDKVRKSEAYAQNLYACLCNNYFRKNEVLPILKEENWSCSWRYAGGIIADMLGKGDYIDWYCSGIVSDLSDEDFNLLNKYDQERYLFVKNHYVGEGVITEEIQKDLLKLGWITIQE